MSQEQDKTQKDMTQAPEENKEEVSQNQVEAADTDQKEPTATAEADKDVKSEASAEAPSKEDAAGKAEAADDADADKEAKRKAAAEARAARAAAKAAETAEAGEGDADKEAKRKAAAEARAARAAARAKKEEEPAEPKPPSPNQPRLDRLVEILKEVAGEEAIEEAFINEHDQDLPVVSVKADHWHLCAKTLKEHPELKLNFLRNVSGVDYETYFEVVYHLISLETKLDYCIKVKTDHEAPAIPSVVDVWNTANWQEREIYDLLGIEFPGHPDLRRIMLPDDWEGHPLRKDYVPIDPEV